MMRSKLLTTLFLAILCFVQVYHLKAQCANIFFYRMNGPQSTGVVNIFMDDTGLYGLDIGNRVKSSICIEGEYTFSVKLAINGIGGLKKVTLNIENGRNYYFRINNTIGLGLPTIKLQEESRGSSEISKNNRFGSRLIEFDIPSQSIVNRQEDTALELNENQAFDKDQVRDRSYFISSRIGADSVETFHRLSDIPIIRQYTQTKTEYDLSSFNSESKEVTITVSIELFAVNSNGIMLGLRKRQNERAYLYRSIDSGRTWEDISKNLSASDQHFDIPSIVDVFAINESFFIVDDLTFLGDKQRLIRSDDAGSSWEVLSDINRANIMVDESICNRDKNILLESFDGQLLSSNSKGEEWKEEPIKKLPHFVSETNSTSGPKLWQYGEEALVMTWDVLNMKYPDRSHLDYIYGYNVSQYIFSSKKIFAIAVPSSIYKHANSTPLFLVSDDGGYTWLYEKIEGAKILFMDCDENIFIQLFSQESGIEYYKFYSEHSKWELLSGLSSKTDFSFMTTGENGKIYFLYNDGIYESIRQVCCKDALHDAFPCADIGQNSSLTVDQWKEKAQEILSSNTSDKIKNQGITCAYANMYLSNPELYKWSGLAALVSGRIGFEEWEKSLIPDLIGLMNSIMDGNRDVFNDLYWQHLAYDNGGIEEIKILYCDGYLTTEQYDAWKKIHSGNVWVGNKELLYLEQKNILQPSLYEENKALWYLADSYFVKQLNQGENPLISPIPNDETVFPSGVISNIADFDERWNWIENYILPKWKEFESNSSNEVILLRKLKEYCPMLEY